MGKYIGTLLALVVLGGGYLWWQSSQSAPQNQGLVATNEPNTSSQEGANSDAATDTGDVPGADADVDVGVTDEPAVTITYNESGFSPSSVTVKKGEIVRWVNNSSQETWPASGVHPTHSNYPEKTASDCLGSAFDACKGLKSGESWDFTFNTVGEWRYHDHLHTSQTGVVIVQE